MDSSFNFYLDPRQLDPQDLTTGVHSILLIQAGQARSLDPQTTRLTIQQEHPPVERMADDWGAICEVFKQSSSYYLNLPGVTLAPGDRITLGYRHRAHTVTLVVADLENGRVRIDPPVIQAP